MEKKEMAFRLRRSIDGTIVRTRLPQRKFLIAEIVPMSASRAAYFQQWAWQAEPTKPVAPMLLPLSKKAKKLAKRKAAFIEIDGVKALRWNIRSI